MTEIIIGHLSTRRNPADGRSCFRVFAACFVVCWLLILTMPAGQAQAAAQGTGVPSPPSAASPGSPPGSSAPVVLKQYCFTCHNERAKVGGLALDTLDFDHVGPGAETW